MLRFGETERLDRIALRAAAAGAICALTAALLPTASLSSLRWMGPAALLVGTALTNRERLRGLLFGGAALLTYAAFAGYTLFADALSGAVVGYGLSRTINVTHSEKLRKFAAVACAAVAWPLCLEAWSAVTFWSTTQLVVPPLLLQVVAGGVGGLVMGLSPAPLFLLSDVDPVVSAMARMQPTLDAELRTLVHRILEIRTRSLKLIEQSRAPGHVRSEVRRGFDSVAVTAIELTNRFSTVDRILARSPSEELEKRIEELQSQLLEVKDAGVKRDLERTLVSLTEQRLQLDRLVQGRARLVARLQSEQAALEKAEMSFALLASGDAALAGIQLETIGTNLGIQAHELEAEGTALQEMLTVAPRHALAQLRSESGAAV
jgi:prepilin signal peptidase PulO-like enzyme (type II secretory pathway)